MLNHMCLRIPLTNKGNVCDLPFEYVYMAWNFVDYCRNVFLANKIFYPLDSNKANKIRKSVLNDLRKIDLCVVSTFVLYLDRSTEKST